MRRLSGLGYGGGAGAQDAPAHDDSLCTWVKPDESEARQWGGDGEEWYVYARPEQGAAEYAEVDVLAKRSGRVTRVRLGEEVTYCTYRVDERLEVVYEGHGSDGDGDGGEHAQADFRWHPDGGDGAGGAVSRWLVRGESGRVGGAVIVVSGRTNRRTAVFLTREIGSVGGSGNMSLYEFVRC
ncbi:MAG: hypothetical protein OXK17_00790 [Thaumarchaeota archaeon]|nr:hypothetical protein [Nitrososphaerota archaeon]